MSKEKQIVTEKWVTATQNARALEKAYNEGYHDALQMAAKSYVERKICELNKRKKELENQLNISVQNSIENEKIICCNTITEDRK